MFKHSWQREFDIGYQDWEAINKINMKVAEKSGANATVTCEIQYDDTGAGAGHRTGPFKTTSCHLSYGDVGDEDSDE